MPAPLRWLNRLVADAMHQDTITEHGGLAGVRDEVRLESALARPLQIHTYESEASVLRLAAAYGYAIARNHPYHDGNKRMAFLCMTVFAELNGYRVEATQSEAVRAMVLLADGGLNEEQLVEWLRVNAVALGGAG